LEPKNVLKAITLISEMAIGIGKIAEALKTGMTPEELDAFIQKQNELQADLRASFED